VGYDILKNIPNAYIFHSKAERTIFQKRVEHPCLKSSIIPHTEYDMYLPERKTKEDKSSKKGKFFTFTYFGVIRFFKGVDLLIEAFEQIKYEMGKEANDMRLIIAGESWDGFTKPVQMIKQSPVKEDIILKNYYLSDEELGEILRKTDILVFPYKRPCQSGPAHIGMNLNIPIIISDFSMIKEYMQAYSGTRFFEKDDVESLKTTMIQCCKNIPEVIGKTPYTWNEIMHKYYEFLYSILS